jgi:hypothetical protein
MVVGKSMYSNVKKLGKSLPTNQRITNHISKSSNKITVSR